MGFPTSYSPMFLPSLFIPLAFLLAFVRRFLIAFFHSIGLSNLLFLNSIDQSQSQSQSQSPPFFFPSLSALLIQESLPILHFDDLRHHPGYAGAESCAVCLHDFEGSAEVRRLRNCRHVFHRCCLDRWIELDQCSCPLCRSSLIPSHLDDAFFGRRL
ncbi:E3 ubiquitin-protein ligase RHA1B-like [Dioscorea cayenensis subsp. rotundata]|uniref:E3 ubiquitin-protein ligase RHA1B-like n=1 Tax=Dioscorea cayennensis subsp. rotundata TaxID=55577 RepID=A0AB40AIU1_DIOCR|nr:E3 ubiquitin-protein ligase RHA1B-like [Dioscorea cayenensis subsp. rotundata]